ncbi:MAG TPA: hypothetical protein VEA38_10430 [Terriglobales bacterium]|nr:hypothetical protein [Terriglobales bacterium]
MKTFIVRLDVDELGDVVGVVERVRVGTKERFRGYDMLAALISRMVGDEVATTRVQA